MLAPLLRYGTSWSSKGFCEPSEKRPSHRGAHIVGRVDSEKSPRGKELLPVDERDEVDNLKCQCRQHHLLKTF
ncbi:MAG: hypothetical protein ACLPXZ_25935 [Mycobacterium sp.]